MYAVREFAVAGGQFPKKSFRLSRVLEPAYRAGRDAAYIWDELKGNHRDLRVAGRRLRRLRRRCGVGTPSGIAPSGIGDALSRLRQAVRRGVTNPWPAIT